MSKVKNFINRHQRVIGLVGLFPPIWVIGTVIVGAAVIPGLKSGTHLEAGFALGFAMAWPIVLIMGEVEFD